MFGFDTDGPEVFDTARDMIRRLGLDDANLYIPTPYPGTSLYMQFQREGRLLPEKRRTQYGWAHAVFLPKLMSSEELERGVQRVYDELFPYFRKRAVRSLLRHVDLLLRHRALTRVLVSGFMRRAHVGREG